MKTKLQNVIILSVLAANLNIHVVILITHAVILSLSGRIVVFMALIAYGYSYAKRFTSRPSTGSG